VVGEIALLRATPRTASVHAVGPALVLGVAREEFLAAATGSEAARSAADALVAERLARSPS
jgi:CRP-like cAMP-binding protein